MIEFHIDPEELKRLAAQAEQELNQAQPPATLPQTSDALMTPPAGATMPLLAGTEDPKEPDKGSDHRPMASSVAQATEADGAPRRWAEFVTPASNRARVHL